MNLWSKKGNAPLMLDNLDAQKGGILNRKKQLKILPLLTFSYSTFQ